MIADAVLSLIGGKSWSVTRRSGSLDLPESWLSTLLGGRASAAGVPVSSEAALGLSAYYACLRNISEDVAKLPIGVFRRLLLGREAVDGHPVFDLLNATPNENDSAIDIRTMILHWALGWGNGYAEIGRDKGGKPLALYPIHPSRVQVKFDAKKRRYYVVYGNVATSTVQLPASDVFHLHGLGDEFGGYSVARLGCDSIGRALAAQESSARFFANGIRESGVLQHPGTLGEAAVKNLREAWSTMYSGMENHYRPMVLEEGMTWQRSSVPPDEAQMLETIQFTVEDVARWFRCPPSKIGHFLRAQGWSTLEQLNTDYVTDTLTPWAIRFEQEAKRKLFVQAESSLYIKHNFGALLRGDTAARGSFYNTMRRLGAFTVNDILSLEDHNPIGPEGDVRLVEANMTSLDRLLNPPEPEPIDPPDEKEDEQKPPDTRTQAIRDAADDSFRAVVHKLARKEIRALRAAVRKFSDHPQAGDFGQWAAEWYGGFQGEIAVTISPSLAVCILLDEKDETAERAASQYVSSRRGQILGVFRDESLGGVTRRLDKWQDELEATNADH